MADEPSETREQELEHALGHIFPGPGPAHEHQHQGRLHPPRRAAKPPQPVPGAGDEHPSEG